jgi:hypothetical protein
MSRKTPLYARPAGRNRSDQYAQALKKITNAIKKTHNYTEHDKREINKHIEYRTIKKTMGLQSH